VAEMTLMRGLGPEGLLQAVEVLEKEEEVMIPTEGALVRIVIHQGLTDIEGGAIVEEDPLLMTHHHQILQGRRERGEGVVEEGAAKGVRYRLTGGGHFQPARRVVRSSKKCDVCATRDCRTKVHHKEFDSAEQMALKLRPSRRYGGGDDI
ncbi:hypothetical protein FOL47_006071, partial [Perkinsus chesapeaki]